MNENELSQEEQKQSEEEIKALEAKRAQRRAFNKARKAKARAKAREGGLKLGRFIGTFAKVKADVAGKESALIGQWWHVEDGPIGKNRKAA